MVEREAVFTEIIKTMAWEKRRGKFAAAETSTNLPDWVIRNPGDETS